MKKLFAALLALTLMVSLAACGSPVAEAPPVESSTPAAEPSTPPSEPSSSSSSSTPEAPESSGSTSGDTALSAENAGAEVTVSTSKNVYSLEEIVEVVVTLKNTGKAELFYIQGSSSVPIPDALKLTVGELTPLYLPLTVTDDFGITSLKPGESRSYTLNYAPYKAKAPNTFIGNDKDIAFFKDNKDFEPATGKVSIKAVFSMALLSDPFQPMEEGYLWTAEASHEIEVQ